MSYNNLTTYERSRIEVLHKTGNSNRGIALSLGLHRSSIGREFNRNSCAGHYQAEQGEQNYRYAEQSPNLTEKSVMSLLQSSKKSFFDSSFSTRSGALDLTIHRLIKNINNHWKKIHVTEIVIDLFYFLIVSCKRGKLRKIEYEGVLWKIT